jgi:2-octaprenyl-6-methoxyphenol hydroxylase
MLNSQKICIIGSGLTGSTIAYLLSKLNLQIDIVDENYNKKIIPTKLALSKSSLDQLHRFGLKEIKNKSNPVKDIYLHDCYSEINLEKDLRFSSSNKEKILAYIIDSKVLHSDVNKKLKNLNNINLIKKKISSINDNKTFKTVTFENLIKKNYSLVILTSNNNLNLIPKINLKEIIHKSYNENAYAFSLNHKKIKNNSARQFFLKDGPLAFLPVSSSTTFVIWSIKKDSINKKYFLNKGYLLNFFNKNFKELFNDVISVSDINIFNLDYIFNELKEFKRTLLFGDIASKIHPIAGQGWNMTLRNIFSLVKVIKDFENLGLEIGNNIFLEKYLDEVKLNNFTFTMLIDGIREVFDIKNDRYASIRKGVLSVIDKNSFLKNNLANVADKGLFI